MEGTTYGWILYVIVPFNGCENLGYDGIQREIIPPFRVMILFPYLPLLVSLRVILHIRGEWLLSRGFSS